MMMRYRRLDLLIGGSPGGARWFENATPKSWLFFSISTADASGAFRALATDGAGGAFLQHGPIRRSSTRSSGPRLAP